MNLKNTFLKILRRPFFKGQHRIFNYLFKHNYLRLDHQPVVEPLIGNFKIKCDTNTWIGAQIVYLGEYEDYIKATFKNHINKGDTVLDIGANIGFHTLYFSELVGNTGKVIAFEPILSTFSVLTTNVKLNDFENIILKNIALGDENKILEIYVDNNNQNPGENNLFTKGNTLIDCKKGDDILANVKVDFIKIDVEGYELFALKGLFNTLQNHRPKIVFEYDKNYQLKNNEKATVLFDYLSQFDYSFYKIERKSMLKLTNFDMISSADILAIPN